MPFCFSLKLKPWCQTLSSVLGQSRKTERTLRHFLCSVYIVKNGVTLFMNHLVYPDQVSGELLGTDTGGYHSKQDPRSTVCRKKSLLRKKKLSCTLKINVIIMQVDHQKAYLASLWRSLVHKNLSFSKIPQISQYLNRSLVRFFIE